MNNQGPKNIRGGCAAQTLGHPSNAMVSFNTPALMILVYLKGGKKEALRNVTVQDGTDVAPTCQRSCKRSRPSLPSV